MKGHAVVVALIGFTLLGQSPVLAQMNTTTLFMSVNATESMAPFQSTKMMDMPMTTAAPTPAPTPTPTPTPAPTLPKIDVPGLGAVTQLTPKKTFAVPPAAGATLALDGDYSNVQVVFPAGAWPAGVTDPPTMQLLEAPASLEPVGSGTKLGGPLLQLGPAGITFTQNVTVKCPVDASKFESQYEYMVYKVITSGTSTVFENRFMGQAISGSTTPKPTTIDGTTNSFSIFVVRGTTPVAEEDDDGGRSCGDGCIAGAVIGSVFGAALLGAGGYWVYMNKMGGNGDDDRYAPDPVGRQQARDEDQGTA